MSVGLRVQDEWRPLAERWHEALYGRDGFYRRAWPVDHFRTSAHVGHAFADAIVALARKHRLTCVYDIGAGAGELLEQVAAGAPDLDLVAIEPGGRPADATSGIEWREHLPATMSGLVVANELLDVVPCQVVALDESSAVRIVEVDRSGRRERLGRRIDEAEASWLARWWPLDRPGDRAEIGRSREEVWAEVCSRTDGVCVAIDYGHMRTARPVAGSLTAYRAGRRVDRAYDGSCDITAHLAVDALQARVGGGLSSQRESLQRLWDRAPADTGGSGGSRLSMLRERSERGELTSRDGLGGHWWLVTETRAAKSGDAP